MNRHSIHLWAGTASLAASWLFGLDYFYPANPWAWITAIVVAMILYTIAAGGNPWLEWETKEIQEPSTPVDGDRRSGNELTTIVTILLLLPVVWYASWPYRAAPLLIASGLLIRLYPARSRLRRFFDCALLTGLVLLAQSLALQLYENQTARSHELFWPLPELLAGIANLLGMDASASGSSVVIHSMRETHHLGATWELFLDPATFLFFIGAAAMLLLSPTKIEDPDCEIPHPSFLTWLREFRILTLTILAWLPIRAGLMMAVFMHRVVRSDPDRPLHAMNHLLSPWILLALLVPPVLLAWQFVAKGKGRRGKGEKSETADRKSPISNPPFPIPNSCLFIPLALVAVSVILFTLAIDWAPVGPRHDGRVMVVERHSTWEPTNVPYDTKSFGEASGYNYAAIYNYLGQYYQMSRLLEKDKIDEQSLAHCDVLIVKNPTVRYSPDELDAIRTFVERGGGLLLLGDHTNLDASSTILNDITRPMGFIFRDDLLFGFGDSPYDEHFIPPAVPHPSIEHTPPFDFAVSCSIDPGDSSGRPAIINAGLWSMGPEYHHANYHPFPQHCAEMRFGPFIQAWAANVGTGRAIAFTDSTIFSNFCVFQPGKAEVMVNMVEWLNHGPSFSPRPWLLLLGLIIFVPTFAKIISRSCNRQSDFWLLLLAVGMFSWTAASLAASAMNRWAMPSPECVRPMTRVVIDRVLSTVPLSNGADTQGDGSGFGLLEQWIARLGCYTIRQDGDGVFSGKALVVLYPSHSVLPEYREKLRQYVADGGKLLVVDSPENARSTANSLVNAFGLTIHHDLSWQGKLEATSSWSAVEISQACKVTGGESLIQLGDTPIGAMATFQKGTVIAIGFGSLWSDTQMGGHWMLEPDAATKGRYDFLFSLLRSWLEGKPLPASPKKPAIELPMQESGPAEM